MRRRSVLRLVRLGTVAVAAGCTGQANYVPMPASPPPPEPGPITGTVLDGNGRPLPGQIVAIGAEKITSDGDGHFSFSRIPVGYDLVIASPDRSQATVYQGLGRRDPVVVHKGPHPGAPAHNAQIVVTLSGGDAVQAAADRWQVRFVSPLAFAAIPNKSAWTDAGGKLESAAWLAVSWDGADTIAGTVLAFAMRLQRTDIPLALFAQQTITLRDGQRATIDLAPARVSVVRRPRPRVILPKEDPGFAPNYTEEYRLPGVGLAVNAAGRMGHTYDIPDLRPFGLQLCGYGFQWNPYVRSGRTVCGVDPASQTDLPLPSPPEFTAPTYETVAEVGLRFAWTPVPNAVYRLHLKGVAGTPTAALPSIEIVTAKTTAGWPDLGAVGIGFPVPLAAYEAIVGARGPYASIDDFVAPQRRSDQTARERWNSESQDLGIAVEPPRGNEEAACRYPDTVVCGTGGQGVYVLSAINRKIRRFPDFAAAVNIHCVPDCASAEVWSKAYRDYAAAHPGFDAHEPLPAMGRIPPPPPGMFKGRPRPD
ncbi:MAG TPA: carboxypeptidase-like regulatory domain-containing protein [Polyangia bacterium]|nr:carboxypeptidase-like regulatory domain-containing protein [Polyangia bacterium]